MLSVVHLGRERTAGVGQRIDTVMGRTARGSPPPTVMRRGLAITALAGAFALLPSTAWASGNDVIRDCTDNGRIDNRHGPLDYQQALANLPSDVDEYTDCRSIIWAITPDVAWTEANRTVAYVAAFAGAIGIARLAPEHGRSILIAVMVA